MKMSTFCYYMRQGLKNIRRNKLFSLASVVTIAACIFLFGVMYAILANVQYMTKEAEESVGISVFFAENLTQDQIDDVGEMLLARVEVERIEYTSAEEAWNTFKDKYFAENPELAEGFAGDNPLANSASYSIFLKDIEEQDAFVAWLRTLPEIRKVNHSELASGGLSDISRLVGYLSTGLMMILLVISLFLISNTISLAYAVRKEEIEVMKYIGATNGFVRAPFIIEGLLIGLVGALLPLGGLYALYRVGTDFVLEKFSILSGVLRFLNEGEVFVVLIPVALALGAGIGFLGSFFTIRKELKV